MTKRLGVLLTLALAGNLQGQAVQSVRSLAIGRDSLAALVSTYADKVSRRLAMVELAMARVRAPADRALLPSLETERRLAHDALEATDDYDRFMRRYNAFRSYDEGLQRAAGFNQDVAGVTGVSSTDFQILAAPSELHKIPDVVFVIGSTITFGHGSTVGALEASTNLLGAAVGTAFNALGSDGLQDYAQDNITVGTAFPVSGPNKLAATLGFGLGGLRIGKFAVWPAINIEQVDSADRRVPSALRTKHPDDDKWSSPLLSVAISAWTLKRIQERLKTGKITPVITLGIRLPYYYPNDPFSALAALFSAKRGDFEVSGKAKFQIGVFFPLQTTKPLAPVK